MSIDDDDMNKGHVNPNVTHFIEVNMGIFYCKKKEHKRKKNVNQTV